MLTGLGGAAAAAVAYGAATILQALGVRRLSRVDPAAGIWARVVVGRLYVLGLALDGLGFLASVAALRQLPLFLVESAVASSVAVTAVLAVLVLGDRLRRGEVAALAVTGAGLVLLALTAQAGPARAAGTVTTWLLLASVAVVAALFLVAKRHADPGRAAIVLAMTSGLGFGVVGIAARTLRVHDPLWMTITEPLVWVVAAQGVLASAAYGYGLHRGRTTTVAAITFAVETVLPTVIGLAFLGDAVRGHLFPIAVIGFLAAVGGSIALAGHAEAPALQPA